MWDGYTGYALNKDGEEEFIIIGVLMKRSCFSAHSCRYSQ